MNTKQQAYQILYGNLWQVNEQKLHILNSKAHSGIDFYQKNSLVKNIIDETEREVKMNNAALLMNEFKTNPITNIINTYKNTTNSKSTPVLLTNTNTEVQANTVQKSTPDLILNWETLANEVKQCTNCNLCYGRKNTVFERGNRNAKWMFIGESPGEAEDSIGTPFASYGGELLDKMITAMQLDPQNDVYICNVIKCRPTYNRNLEKTEMDACRNYILSQIELVKPQIIIALGRFASISLLATDLATAKLRGREYKFMGIPLIVTYHPAYLLRNPEAKKDAWQDLKFAISVHNKKSHNA